MTAEYYPLQVLLLVLSGWVNRLQQRTIEYLVEENRVLKETLKGRKLRLNDDQRRRLAAKGKQLGRRLLNRVATIVTPDTIMRWHRRLIEAKWTFEQRGNGKRGVMKEIKNLVVRLATENSTWGYSNAASRSSPRCRLICAVEGEDPLAVPALGLENRLEGSRGDVVEHVAQ